MKTFLLAALILGIGVFGMCFNIIFRKNGEFPETEVSKNKEMRRLGIKCMHEEEEEMRKGCSDRKAELSCTGDCSGCGTAVTGHSKIRENN
ncbi:MAG: hypothetical protein MJY84_02090 [Bacteroidales bacterium]|nr:hypothetical protein [Bacteroidales bacterium]